LKKTVDELTTSVRNAPSGFKIESYIYRAATPRMPGSTGYGWEGYRPPAPVTIPSTAKAVVYNFDGATFRIDAKNKTPKEAFEEWGVQFRQLQSVTVGPNTNPAEALSYI
jgi:hypothetical protein